MSLALPVTAEAAQKPGCETGFVCPIVIVPGDPGGGTGGGTGGGGGGGGGDTGGGDRRYTCTYTLADPQPADDSGLWGPEGRKPGVSMYIEDCLDNETGMHDIKNIFTDAPPGGGGRVIDPAVVARQAVDKMRLRPPAIGITPNPGGKGVVGMPVYMWTETGPETYGPNVASASIGPVSVTATARVSKIVWNMGDGKTVTCTSAGTPYKSEYGKNPSPDCGHRYDKPSSTTGSGTYHVTATSTWSIDWQVTGGAQGGQLSEVRTSAVDINVAEVQVLN
ncbi:ATP/GTP-binding protein [Streptomyces virginiae]|uniref:ATP/GTP-binding protein n=1 Tax=Streptomyces virginiae TaxID=1961 RepID=UPI00386FAD32|nr:ATP/GTP-binding protein [Streptomyces virginiae]